MKTTKCAAALIDLFATALEIKIVLGRPEVGREKIALPIGSVEFREDAYGVQRARRLGEVPPAGFSDRFSLLVLARHEAQLLGFVDVLRDLKATRSSLTVEGSIFTVRWSDTRRATVDAGEAEFDFCLEVEATVSQS